MFQSFNVLYGTWNFFGVEYLFIPWNTQKLGQWEIILIKELHFLFCTYNCVSSTQYYSVTFL